MNRRVLILWAAALLLLYSGCQKSGRAPAFTSEEAVPVIFRPVLDVVQTRSAGAVESWNGQELVIYGVSRKEDGLSVNDLLLDGVRANAPEEGGPDNIQVLKPDGTPYLYGIGSYDFFAYSVDNATVTGLTKDSESQTISMQVAIDGLQDIMMAYADREKDCEGTAVLPEEAYGQSSARRHVHPRLRFDHQLSRFRFQIKAAPDRPGMLTVKSISVGTQRRAEMLVVKPDFSYESAFVPIGEIEYLQVEAPSTPMVLEEQEKPIGEIMVMPGRSVYPVRLKVEQEGYSYPDMTLDINLDFTEYGGKAERSVIYDIVLTIYGKESVYVDVTMREWLAKGQFNLDPDRDEGNNI